MYKIRYFTIQQRNKEAPTFTMWLLVFIFARQVAAETGLLNTYHVNLPGHIHKIQCPPGISIWGYVTWEGPQYNIDAVMYKEGADLLSNSYVKLYNSTVVENQTITYTPEPEGGTFYVKVLPFELNQPYLHYNIFFVLNGSYFWHDGYYSTALGLITKPAILIPNPAYPLSYNIKYSVSSSLKATVIISNPSTNQSSIKEQNTTFAVPAAPYWMIIVSDDLTTATTLNDFAVSIYYYCPSGQSWSTATSACQQSANSSSNVGTIVGVVVSVVIVIMLLVVLAVYWYRKRNRSSQQNALNSPPWESPNTQKMLIDVNITCSICLQKKCDTTLPCKHHFHTKCISTWFKKAKLCPLCRSSPSEVRIVNFYSQQTTEPIQPQNI